MSAEKFCLKWNNFESNVSCALKDIREDCEFFDVTIACEDKQLQAHKLILSACSSFFKNVLYRNKHQHPLLYLKGISVRDMEAVLNFMYNGEVNVAQDDLNSFLQVAEDLKVKGLTQNNQGDSETDSKDSAPAIFKGGPKSDPHRSLSSECVTIPAAKQLHSSPSIPKTTLQPPREDDCQIISPRVKSEPQDMSSNTHQAEQEQTIIKLQMQDTMLEQQMQESMMEQQMQESMMDQQMQESMMEQYDDHYGDFDGQFVDQGFDQSMAGQDGTGTGLKDTCPVCLKEMLKTNIPKHMKKKHAPDDPAECPFCFKVFKTSYNMKDHVRYMHKSV